MTLEEDLMKRYRAMYKRCGLEYEEEETEDAIDFGDINIYDAKPEAIGNGVKFERIRRCTGYLSGDYQTRFNNAKRAEVEDRMSSKKRIESYHEIS